MPVDVQALDVDFYAVSGHKMLGPTGIGLLYGKRALLEAMPPFLTGGDMIRKVDYDAHDVQRTAVEVRSRHEQHRRCDRFRRRRSTISHDVGMDWIREHEIADHATRSSALAPFEPRGLAIYGPRDPELVSGVISFNFADIHAHDLASILDTEGVCVRAGHHCTMPLMDKMGWPATARASFYLYKTEADIDALVDGSEKAAEVFKI